MSEQALDLRRSVQVVRRHRILVGFVAALGLTLGGAYAAHKPPMFNSTVLLVLPQAAQNAATAADGQTNIYMATQAVIASSYPVLSAALPHVGSAMSVQALNNEIQVKNPTGSIMSISAAAKTAAQAITTANAVANSYITYVSSANSPVGRVQAYVLEPATAGARTAPLKRLILEALVGGLAGALIGVIVALAISRSDRRLRHRDDIANSIGVPVLASFPVDHPTDAAGWRKLLESYEPGSVHAWRLRKALQQLGAAGVNVNNENSSLAVLSLSSDRGAFALGPKLAVFAASIGIPTTLLIGPQQDANVTATLRTACAVPLPASSKRPSQLQVAVCDDGDFDGPPGSVLTVVVVVVDAKTPQVPDTMHTNATVLGVSAGAATAEQLARVAMSAAASGHDVAGILVADPEPTDYTTGRVPQLARSAQHRRPTRLRGMTTEIRR
jgi:capsular polysaccharide biosynthesis protein